MYSYLNVGRWYHPGRKYLENYQISSHKLKIYSTCATNKFKLAVFTVAINTWACSVTRDPCQPTKFKGYRRVFMYDGTEHLIHCIHAL